MKNSDLCIKFPYPLHACEPLHEHRAIQEKISVHQVQPLPFYFQLSYQYNK
jgi:hypothetical protein